MIKQKETIKAIIFGGLFIFVMVIMAQFCLASIENLGTFKQNDCIQIPQICSTCTYNNISSIINPDGTYALNGEYEMTKNGINYNYTFCDTDQSGTYSIGGHGDLNYVDDTFTFYFDITPSGGSSMLGFYIIAIVLCYGLLIFGVYKQDALFGGLGSLALYILGIYIFYYGVDTFRNYLTDAFAAVTIGIAIYGTIQSLKEIGEI